MRTNPRSACLPAHSINADNIYYVKSYPPFMMVEFEHFPRRGS